MVVTEPAADWLHSVAGVQSHHRSLLLWPDLLDGAGWSRVRPLLHTGARILSLGRPLPDGESAALRAVPLEVWGADAPDGPPGGAACDVPGPACDVPGPACDVPGPAEWQQLAALWQQAGLTPLPPTARDDPSWSHARIHRDGRPVAAAGAQQLLAPLGESGARLLVCSVVCEPAARRTGAARRCVQALTAGRGGAAALLEPGSGSDRFFAGIGWRPVGRAYLYRYC
ncbi:hypothetical protein GCM10010193_29210 [Kitasatospora atroaurantiaca]|uniref:N-acetyltransferase domain-containing protein n=1 Tax=Kitasatospora atroaurantiaca TaxID=285545 RepID=A0A561EIS8_9ACTN|nr:hypothetical protein [Kitasatospora atroaurantiaca]TWE15527.1 hypothetical protein FB465_0427 [Kitasatospora atroaurantiaca]